LRERQRLLREIRKKKLQLERVREQMSRDAASATARMAPLIRRHAALTAELRALFSELLTPGRASARARKALVRLRRLLELRGMLDPTPETQPDDDGEPDDEPPPQGRPSGHDGRARVRARAEGAPEVSGASQLGQVRRSLRELFRSLVKAIHPDQARHEAERARRTEVMKEVTRAYEEGDLARLLELEHDWQSERAVSEQADAETRSRALEQANRELLDQVRRLTREIRDLKREAFDASLGLAPDELLLRAGRELDELEEICRFVESFRDGKLGVAELERGPRGLYDHDELESIEQLFSALLDDDDVPRPRRRRRR